jgi:hypothetical protein
MKEDNAYLLVYFPGMSTPGLGIFETKEDRRNETAKWRGELHGQPMGLGLSAVL